MAMKYLDFVFCILAVLTKSGLAVTPPPAAGPTTAGATPGTTAFPGPPLTYTCSQGDVNEIKLTLTVEDGEFTRQMVASDISEVDGEYDDCKSTFSPDSGIHTLVIVFDVDGVQKSPLRSQKNCYVQPADVNGDIFVQVVLQRNPPYVVLGDVPRIVKCNANNLSPTSVEVVDNGVDVFTSNIYNRQKEVAKTTLGDITASLINLDSVTPGLYFVGDTVQVVIEYNYALSQPAPRPIALFVRNLVVYGSEEGFNDRITYVTQNGCKGNGVQQSFQVTSYDDVNSITISQSAPFKLKLFKKSRKAIIKLDFDAMCYTQGSPCQDQQDYCNLNGLSRKRRHVNSDSPLNGTLRLEVPILMPPSTVEDLQNQVSGSDALECSVISTNWILSIVLGSLLLIVIAMCIFLTLRLRSVMDKNVRIVDKMEGTKNEAFY